jgi:hypothetical protein
MTSPSRRDSLPGAAAGAPISSGHLGDRSLVDAAIDSFGLSVPLLEIHEVASACVARNDTNSTADKDDGDKELREAVVQKGPGFHIFTEEEPHKKHPHVATRRVGFIHKSLRCEVNGS